MATILVLEDDLALQELFCDVLQDEGYEVVAAATLPGLLDQLPEAPDLLLSDILVDLQPVGLEAIGAVRSATNRAVPAILCTAAAHHLERFRDEIDQLDAMVLTKPFSIDSLLDAITKALAPRSLYV